MASITRILVGIDGRSGGRSALGLARRLSWIHDADIVVAAVDRSAQAEHSLVPWRGPLTPEDSERVLARARLHLHGATNARFVRGSAGLPGYGLQALAVEHHADLLVVGRSTRGAVARAIGADVVAQALDHPPCPVAVAPPRYRLRTAPLARIVVASGPDQASLDAVRWALELADHAEERVPEPELIHVEPLADGTAPGPGLVARSRNADLLVVGTHARGRVGRAALGSVSLEVVRHADCPVVVVPVIRSTAPV